MCAAIQDQWVSVVVGRALNPDGFAENQCVDVVDHYGEYIFGVPWSVCVGGVRGAKDLLDVAPDKYWIRIDYYLGFIPQPGDIGVMGGSDINEWGHTFYTESADANGIDVIQQDGFAPPLRGGYSIKPAHRSRLAYYSRGTGSLIGVLRPRPEMMIGGILPAGNTTQEEDDMTQDEVRAVIREELKLAVQPGEAGVRNAGPLYDLAEDLKWLRATFTTGEAGKRQAGEALRIILEAASNG